MSRTPSRRGLSGKSKDDLLNLAGVGSIWTTGGVAQKGTTISKEIEPARKKASVMKPPTKKDYSDSKMLKVRKKEVVQKSPALSLQVLKATVDKNSPAVQSQTKATASISGSFQDQVDSKATCQSREI
jgi:hypothetical protein